MPAKGLCPPTRAILIDALRDAHRRVDEVLSDPRLALKSIASRGQDCAIDPDDPVARFLRAGEKVSATRRGSLDAPMMRGDHGVR
jgi:hypothetical protein